MTERSDYKLAEIECTGYGMYQAKRTDLWCKSRGSTDFTSRRSEVDDLDFIGVLEIASISA